MVAEAEKAQQEAVVKQDLYEEALASLERASLDLEQQADIIDSLKQNNLKNLIRRYHDVFVYDEYVKVTFDTIRGSIILTNRDIRKDLFVQRNEPIMQKELKNYLQTYWFIFNFQDNDNMERTEQEKHRATH